MDLSSLIPTSWRTTLSGVIGGLALLVTQLLTLTDADPKTNPDLGACVLAVSVMVGFSVARDANVSSQQEGIR